MAGPPLTGPAFRGRAVPPAPVTHAQQPGMRLAFTAGGNQVENNIHIRTKNSFVKNYENILAVFL